MTRECPTCDGEGVIKSEETVALELERQLRDLAKEDAKKGVEAFLVQVNPRVSAEFTRDGARVLHHLEARTGKAFYFEGSEGLPLDHLHVTMEGERDEVAERALPFSEGDEVYVHIVEPHMYEADDAVAKIDGYIVSVRGGGRFVGEKKLVRIEEAGRTAATAALVDAGEPDGDAGSDSAGDEGGRRRGRRGGRRRSRATAEAS